MAEKFSKERIEQVILQVLSFGLEQEEVVNELTSILEYYLNCNNYSCFNAELGTLVNVLEPFKDLPLIKVYLEELRYRNIRLFLTKGTDSNSVTTEAKKEEKHPSSGLQINFKEQDGVLYVEDLKAFHLPQKGEFAKVLEKAGGKDSAVLKEYVIDHTGKVVDVFDFSQDIEEVDIDEIYHGFLAETLNYIDDKDIKEQ